MGWVGCHGAGGVPWGERGPAVLVVRLVVRVVQMLVVRLLVRLVVRSRQGE